MSEKNEELYALPPKPQSSRLRISKMLNPVQVKVSFSAYCYPILQHRPNSTNTTTTFDDFFFMDHVLCAAFMIESSCHISMEVCGFVFLIRNQILTLILMRFWGESVISQSCLGIESRWKVRQMETIFPPQVLSLDYINNNIPYVRLKANLSKVIL